MSQAEAPRDITLADFGIDEQTPEFCPKCKTNNLVIAADRASWHCKNSRCSWAWSLARQTGGRMIWDAQEVAPELMRWHEHGMPEGESMGWPELDPHLKIRRGEWTVVTGWSSHGKSQFMDAVMVNLADKAHWKFALFSPENLPYAQHVRGLLQKVAGKRFRSRNGSPAMDKEEVLLGLAWLRQHVYFVDAVEPTFETILAQFWRLVKEKDIQGVIIDPWNELEHDRPPGMSETEYTAKVLIRFRDFCKAAHVHGWIVAHPSKVALTGGGTKREKDDTKRPVVRLMDISGSAHFENKPFNGVSVWRNPGSDDLAERDLNTIYILKHRTEGVGRVGSVVLSWDAESTMYHGPLHMLRPGNFALDRLKEHVAKFPGIKDWRDWARRLEEDWWLKIRPVSWSRVPKDLSHFDIEFRVKVGNLEASAWRAEKSGGDFTWWASFEHKGAKFTDVTEAATREAAFTWAERWLMQTPEQLPTTEGE